MKSPLYKDFNFIRFEKMVLTPRISEKITLLKSLLSSFCRFLMIFWEHFQQVNVEFFSIRVVDHVGKTCHVTNCLGYPTILS
jgi:hypothetical protein